MKKLLLTTLAFCAFTAFAQNEIVVGDMNDDGELTIGDVTALTATILGDQPTQTHVCKVNSFISDNGDLLGLWGDGTRSVTFNADGTSTLGHYIFKPQLGRILIYNDNHDLVDFLLVHELTSNKLEMSTKDGTIFNYTRGQAEDYQHEYVDLALPSGTLWATCNIGASSPYDIGEYFAWGETVGSLHGKTNFNWGTYKYYSHTTSSNDKTSPVMLDGFENAAVCCWGEEWDIPTRTQLSELLNTNNVTISKEIVEEKAVIKITSKNNGNFIYLPAAGKMVGTSVTAPSYYTMWTQTRGKVVPTISVSVYGDSFAYASRYGLTSGNIVDLEQCCFGIPIRPVRVSTSK